MAKVIDFSTARKAATTQVVTDQNDVQVMDRTKANVQQGLGPEEIRMNGKHIAEGAQIATDDTGMTKYDEELNEPNRPNKAVGTVEGYKVIDEVVEDVIYTGQSVGDVKKRAKFANNTEYNGSTAIVQEVLDTNPPVSADLVPLKIFLKDGVVTNFLTADKTVHCNTSRFGNKGLSITHQYGKNPNALGKRFAKMIADKTAKLADGVDYPAFVTLPNVADVFNTVTRIAGHATEEVLLALITARKYMSLASSDRVKYGHTVNDEFAKYKDGVLSILALRNDDIKINNTSEITYLNYLPGAIRAAEETFKKTKWLYDAGSSFLTKEEVKKILFGRYTAEEGEDYIRKLTYGTGAIRHVRPYAYGDVTLDVAKGDTLAKAAFGAGFGGANTSKYWYQTGRGKAANPKKTYYDPVIDGICDFLKDKLGSGSYLTKTGVTYCVDPIFSEYSPEWSLLILVSMGKIAIRYAVLTEDLLSTLEKLSMSGGFERLKVLNPMQYEKLVKYASVGAYNQERLATEVDVKTRFNYPAVARDFARVSATGKDSSKTEYLPYLVSDETFIETAIEFDDKGKKTNSKVEFNGRFSVPSDLGEGDSLFNLMKTIDPVLLIDDTNFEGEYTDSGEGSSDTETEKKPLYNFNSGFYFNFDFVTPIAYLKGRQMFGVITSTPAWMNDMPYGVASILDLSTMSEADAKDDGKVKSAINAKIKAYNAYFNAPFCNGFDVYDETITVNKGNKTSISRKKGSKHECLAQLSTWSLHFPVKTGEYSYMHIIVNNGAPNNTYLASMVQRFAELAGVDLKTNEFLINAGIVTVENDKAIVASVSEMIGLELYPKAFSDAKDYYARNKRWAYWYKRMHTWYNLMLGMRKKMGVTNDASFDVNELPHQFMHNPADVKVRIQWYTTIENTANLWDVPTTIEGTADVTSEPADNPTPFCFSQAKDSGKGKDDKPKE